MKKLISILLLAAMLLALTACGAAGKAEDTAAADKLKEAAQKVEEAAAAAEEAALAEETVEEAAEAAPAEEAAPVEEEQKAEEMIGEKTASTYVNEGLGIRAEFPANWTVLDDEQTAQVMGLVADHLSEEDLADQLRESGSLCDLYAMATDQSGDNVNIMIQDLGVLYGIVLDENRYTDLNMDQIEPTLSQMGMTDITMEKANVTFAGAEHPSILVSANYSGVPVYEQMVIFKAGNYMSAITVFSVDKARVDQILGFFSAFEG